MAELDKLGDELNFDWSGSFGLHIFSYDELLLTEANLTEQTEHFHRWNQAVSEYSYQKNRSQLQNNNFFVVEWFSI